MAFYKYIKKRTRGVRTAIQLPALQHDIPGAKISFELSYRLLLKQFIEEIGQFSKQEGTGYQLHHGGVYLRRYFCKHHQHHFPGPLLLVLLNFDTSMDE